MTARSLDLIRDALVEIGPLGGVEMLDAVATTCLLLASADGAVSEAETVRIATTLMALTGTTEDLTLVQAALATLGRQFGARTTEEHIQDLAARLHDPAQRRRALSYAAGVAYADDHLGEEEEALLMRLAQAFGIRSQEAAGLIGQFRKA
ncbi:MAG: hypothetical protein EXR72_18440 [Myxococcales bacterium]|nr:hypothetical protein [Myxococcales bacterium]